MAFQELKKERQQLKWGHSKESRKGEVEKPLGCEVSDWQWKRMLVLKREWVIYKNKELLSESR